MNKALTCPDCGKRFSPLQYIHHRAEIELVKKETMNTESDEQRILTEEDIEELVTKINDFVEAARAMGLPVTIKSPENQQLNTKEGNPA